MKVKNVLGWVAGICLTLGIVWAGNKYISTDGQLIVLMVCMMSLITLMGVTIIYMRSQRTTKRALYSGKVHRRSYDPIPKLEQTILQLTTVLIIAMILMGAIQKGPKVWRVGKVIFAENYAKYFK